MPNFIMTIAKKAKLSEENAGMTTIVIRRPYAHLENELRNTFKGRDDVKVIVDRRFRERRKKEKPVAGEQRKSDRRRQKKEELVEVILSP
jgi:predicted GIY-YIG superfamily endonuclease